MEEKLRLTQTVQKGGCAAKIAAYELRQLLSKLQFPPKHPQTLVDGSGFDDAAVIKISSELASVQTLDFFTPILDNPRNFGRVAAANALSDVFAMGGDPQTALAILAYPVAILSSEVIAEVLQGACDVMASCQVSLVGGHSIDDDTLKFGLSVFGTVHPDKIWKNSGAQVGDQLILTKPLGTGTICAGLKRQAWTEEDMTDVIESMSQVNQVKDLLGSAAEFVHAATDITGFGLMGHSMQMAKASNCSLLFEESKIPRFQKAKSALAEGFLTKAHRTNKEYTKNDTLMAPSILIGSPEELILFDPQTSGGLLMAVSPSQADLVLNKLKSRFLSAAIVGKVEKAQAEATNQYLLQVVK